MNRLLMIEDDIEFAGLIDMALQGKVTVLVKNNPVQLIEVMEDFKPDIVLLDNHVGLKTAREIIAEIRDCTNYASIPFILVSAHPNVEQIAKELKANSWLLKPFKLTDLYQSIETLLGKEK